MYLLIENGSFISIHALLAESDGACSKYAKYGWVFLSTLSLRRATACVKRWENFTGISIHALLAESDAGLLSAAHSSP